MRIPDAIAEQIRTAVLSLDSSRGLPDRVGREHGAIPLLADLGGAVLLRPDGVVLELEWDQHTERHPRELAEPASTVPLVAGCERYAFLKALLPSPPSSAPACSTCQGTGRIFAGISSGHVFCPACGALGWIAPG